MRKRKGKRLFVVVIILSVLLILFLLFFSLFKLDRVTFSGNTIYTEEELKEKLFTSPFDRFTIFFYLRNHFFTQDKIPFIEQIEMEMDGWDTIHISIYEKAIAGCIELMGSYYFYFDRDGIVVDSDFEKRGTIPVVTGLEFERVMLQEPLVIQKQELFKVILELTQLIQLYEIPAQEINFNSAYEVTLFCDKNKVLLGKKEYYDQVLSALKNILLSAEEQSYLFDLRNYTKDQKDVIAKPLQKVSK